MKRQHKLCLLALTAFTLMKLPMIFGPFNPEELRDYDHYTQVAEGAVAMKDFVWIYGPLSPLVYGAALKILPHRLITVRAISFVFWCVGLIFLTLTLALFMRSDGWVLFSSIFSSAVFGYPTYCHNHVMVGAALLGMTYFWFQYSRGDKRAVYFSFACVLVALFTRPLLMGYGAVVFWLVVYTAHIANDWKSYKAGQVALLLGMAGFSLAGFFAIYGVNLWASFAPYPWAFNPVRGYPNLINLVPFELFKQQGISLFSGLKFIRISAETFLFYFQYFIFPGILGALLLTHRDRVTKGAAWIFGLSVLSSLDLLYYGFESPGGELALTVRGQFFMSLTLVSVCLLLNRYAHLWQQSRSGFASVIILGATVFTWAMGPWLSNVFHMSKRHTDPSGSKMLSYLYIDQGRTELLRAAKFINERCSESDLAVAGGYMPGFRHLIQCQEPFSKDAYAFTRRPEYVFRDHENPYAPGGTVNHEFLRARLRELDPPFMVREQWPPGWLLEACAAPDVKHQDFGTKLQVCYKTSRR